MNKRVAVRVALILVALVLLAAALPFGSSAAGPVTICGHVWEISSYPDPWGGEPQGQGVPGVQVILKRNGVPYGYPKTTNENGDFLFQVSGQPGTYTLVVNVPVGLTTPDGRSAFMFDGAVRLGEIENGVPARWTKITGLTSPEYSFTLDIAKVVTDKFGTRLQVGPIDFLYTCSGAAPMKDPARPDGLPCYNPAWNRVFVSGVAKIVVDPASKPAPPYPFPIADYSLRVGGVKIELWEMVLNQDGTPNWGAWQPAMRLVSGSFPKQVQCTSNWWAPNEGFWGMAFTYRPTWYKLRVTLPAGYTIPTGTPGWTLAADGKWEKVFAYCEGTQITIPLDGNWWPVPYYPFVW